MKNNKGVTLAELSIVLVIIGLLLAAVVAGLGIRKSSEVRGFMTQISGFQVAFEGFDAKYSDLPGDMSNAFTYWSGTTCSAAGTDTECNGDSDSRIENGPGSNVATNETTIASASDVESFRAWQHLVLSEFLDGSYTGIGTGAQFTGADIGINIPASKRTKVGYSVAFSSTHNRNEFMLGAFDSAKLNTNAALTPAEALAIDKKIDDGKPNSGIIYGLNGSDMVLVAGADADGTGNNCILGTAYNIANLAVACAMNFPVKP